MILPIFRVTDQPRRCSLSPQVHMNDKPRDPREQPVIQERPAAPVPPSNLFDKPIVRPCKVCEQCGAAFDHVDRSRRFCSKGCWYAYKSAHASGANSPSYNHAAVREFKCHHCGTVVQIDGKGDVSSRKFCSNECRQKGRDRATGEQHPFWRGGRRVLSNGYVVTLAWGHPRANRGYVYEHILVAERALGRYLPPGAEVHHVNRDRGDNRPSNLVICQDHAYHALLHVLSRRRQKGVLHASASR